MSRKKEASERVKVERRKQREERRMAPEEKFEGDEDEPVRTIVVEEEPSRRALFGLFRF